MATNKPQDDYQKQGMRIPRELHTRIHESAAAAGRSYNSELIARLELSFAERNESDLSAEMLRGALESNQGLAQAFIEYLTTPGADSANSPQLMKMTVALTQATASALSIFARQFSENTQAAHDRAVRASAQQVSLFSPPKTPIELAAEKGTFLEGPIEPVAPAKKLLSRRKARK